MQHVMPPCAILLVRLKMHRIRIITRVLVRQPSLYSALFCLGVLAFDLVVSAALWAIITISASFSLSLIGLVFFTTMAYRRGNDSTFVSNKRIDTARLASLSIDDLDAAEAMLVLCSSPKPWWQLFNEVRPEEQEESKKLVENLLSMHLLAKGRINASPAYKTSDYALEAIKLEQKRRIDMPSSTSRNRRSLLAE